MFEIGVDYSKAPPADKELSVTSSFTFHTFRNSKNYYNINCYGFDPEIGFEWHHNKRLIPLMKLGINLFLYDVVGARPGDYKAKNKEGFDLGVQAGLGAKAYLNDHFFLQALLRHRLVVASINSIIFSDPASWNMR